MYRVLFYEVFGILKDVGEELTGRVGDLILSAIDEGMVWDSPIKKANCTTF